ncbi:MAG: PAS domain-containing sensor histidine kinase [Haloarculaceae archaeon]
MGENTDRPGSGEERDGDRRLSESLPSRPIGEQVLDAVPEVVIVFDPGGHAVWWNDRTMEVTGYGNEELAEGDTLAMIADGDPEELIERFRTAADEGRPVPVEVDVVTAAGERLPYEFVGARLPNAEDEAVGIVVTGRNIADRRARRELERQNERLDEFASVVSHDLRGPLSVAQGYLSLAREGRDSDELAKAADAVERMGDLVDDLLALAREGEAVGETTPVDLGDTAGRAWEGLGAVGTLELASPPTVEADPSRLRALLENLFRNAVEHGSTDLEAGDIDGAVEREEAGGTAGTQPADGGENGDGITVRVGTLPDRNGFYVEDDGQGIPEDDREQVFESGYTTSEDGTGFGLAIVRTIAEAHDWSVTLTENEAGGARFEFVTRPG